MTDHPLMLCKPIADPVRAFKLRHRAPRSTAAEAEAGPEVIRRGRR